MWLTDKEREENRRRDEDARRQGYQDAGDRERQQRQAKRDGLVRSARNKLSAEEFAAVIDAARYGDLRQ